MTAGSALRQIRGVRAGFVLAVMLLAGLGGGCRGPVKGLYPPPPGQAPATMYVLHRGLHTGVIVRSADIPPGLWPERAAFPGAEYLEAGWGDSAGYRFEWTARIVLQAMFCSTSSVVLVHGFSGPIIAEYIDVADEIIAVELSPKGFARLCAYIQDTYALDPQGRPIPLEAEWLEEEFYLAKGHYWMLDNCNNWTARVLRAAGCPITPCYAVLPGNVMFQTRRFGRVVWSRGWLKE